MRKPRLKHNSAGWWFGTRYCPDHTLPGGFVWTGPYQEAWEARLGASMLHIVSWRSDVHQAPRDGTPFIAMARFPDATAGFPQMVVWQEGAFRQIARSPGEIVVVWAWMPRDVLGSWPEERGVDRMRRSGMDIGSAMPSDVL